MAALEKRLDRQERASRELEFRINSGSGQDRLDDIAARMESAFGELGHVVQVHYAVLPGGTWHVIAVHTMNDRVRALNTIVEKAIQVEDAFQNLDVVPVVLHLNEVLPEHLARTKVIFVKDGAVDKK